jgi:predicted branched-subunit amino acid permease
VTASLPPRFDVNVRAGIRDIIPVALGVAPFGVTIGATAATTSVDHLAAWLGGPLIAAGAAHLSMVTLLDVGASALAVIVVALIVNTRFAAYSAVLAPRFTTQPRWFKLAGAYVLVDQTFALAASRPHHDDVAFRRYLLTASALLLASWTTAISVGMALGPVVPETWELWFTLPLMMVALTASSLIDRPALVAAATAIVLTLALDELPSGVGLVTAILLGAATGHVSGRRPWTS